MSQVRTVMAPIPLVQRVPHLLKRSEGKRVLHLGCTNAPYTAQSLADGSLLHLRLRDVASELHGVDIDRAGLDVLASRGVTHLHAGDIGDLAGQLTAAGPFDVVIAGEIVEHLTDPGTFLKHVHKVMGPQTRLLVSTVNAYCGFRLAQYALRGRGGHAEPVHPDHVSYYSQATLARLLTTEGFVVTGQWFYDLGTEHLPYTRWPVRWTNAVLTRLAPQLADGVIAECRTSDSPERA
jgi:2-polyprenyl-3-methyl-5-hydroxy-6-metoxy-1,4-benzoquinol methylase